MIGPRQAARPRIPFRSVNLRGRPGYDPHLQRHHVLPRQVLAKQSFRRMFEVIGPHRLGFDDFRVNGMLLPTREESALRLRLPLHRGPHRRYNEMVIERVGQIERDWTTGYIRFRASAGVDATMRLSLLRAALRRRLLDSIGRSLMLNRSDPRGAPVDFSDLDAMADALWGATEAS